MSNPGEANTTPVRSVRQLADYLQSGCKPRDRWRIGTEHEKFVFLAPPATPALAPAPYRPAGIEALLEAFAAEGGERIEDGGNLIGLKLGEASLSLEPGGQFELSGAPLASLHDTQRELADHLSQARRIGRMLNLGFLLLGFHPTGFREDFDWMPKSRYAIMRRYMPRVGTLGHDMMLRTCTVQVNLDTESEADMVRKFRVSLALQPLATALFANSPFIEGRPSGFFSMRARVWTDTDNARSGIPACVFEPGFGFERWAEYLLDVPMYFVARGGRLRDVAGESFRDWMAGRVPALADVEPTLGDFADHSTTVFTDVRLKRFLEMRGADAGSEAMMVAQSALWVGLLYDPGALGEAEALTRGVGQAELVALRGEVPRLGLSAVWRGRDLRGWARDVVAIAKRGLKGRGLGEEALLAPLEAIAEGAPNQAEHWLARYATAWGEDVRRIFEEAVA